MTPTQQKSSSALFSSLRLSQALVEVVQELGFTQMTPIQAQSIPLLLEGKDLVGQSMTGSGKTAAFGLPLLEKLNVQNRQVQALILCPTRELCTQVAREIRKLGRRHSGLQVLIVSGGQPMYPQLTSLKKGVHCVVGTPGRVLDHLTRESLDLSQVEFLILDEADRMLDMGFEEEMEQILKKVPKNRQTIFFSATYPSSIDSLSRLYQKSPIRVTIEEPKEKAGQIRQIFYEADSSHKYSCLLQLIQQHQPESAIIFCNLKSTVIELNRALSRTGVSSSCIHGDLEQSERDRVMAKFRNRSTRILIATDVAARGIDIENLDLVLNFDLPPKPDIYVHRIGRTGRAGKKGLAISLVTPRESGKIQMYEKQTGRSIEKKHFEPVTQHAENQTKKLIQQDALMETLSISGGRKDKMRPGDILGALTGDAGRLNSSDIGKIEIHDRFSYVAVSRKVSELALQRLRDGRIKGKKFRIDQVR